MGTPFEEVYNLFLSQVKMYELAMMNETLLEENMHLWLTGALSYFSHMTTKDLYNREFGLSAFSEELSPQEKVILAKHMTHVYLSTFLITEQNISQALNSRDYRMYSPANQLKALQELASKISRDANTLMSRYSYNLVDVKKFFNR